jgi:hypothetical protein
MARLSKAKHKTVNKIVISFEVVATILLLCMGSLAWWASSFTSSNVHSQLAAQKIYFPPKGSPALASPKIGPYLNRYAGQELLTGPEAKAYADHFIAVHLSEVANGQTYSQVSAAALANPSNAKLKAEEAVLFQGETLRGMLLGDAYAFGTIGEIAQVVAYILFTAGGVMLLLAVVSWSYASKK